MMPSNRGGIMRNITRDNVTDAVINTFAPGTEPRLRLILESLVRHMHAFTREVGLTHEEWRQGLEFLTATGRITDEKRNEFSLLSDLFGISSLVDLLHSTPGATEGSVLGPFHQSGAPFVDNPADLVRGQPGEPVVLQGHVRSMAGAAVPGATVDFWQTAHNGMYPQQDPAQREDNLRCRMLTDADGLYRMHTIRPERYAVPTDGPGGALLDATGRTAWRAAHFHMIVTAPGYHPVTTEIFDASDPQLDSDAVFGVRESLIRAFETGPTGTEVRFDVTLCPA